MPNGQSRRWVAHARHSGIAMGWDGVLSAGKNLSWKGMLLLARNEIRGWREKPARKGRARPLLPRFSFRDFATAQVRQNSLLSC